MAISVTPVIPAEAAPEVGAVTPQLALKPGTILNATVMKILSADLVRIVEGIEGTVPMRMELRVRFDYGSIVPWVRAIDGGVRAVAGPDTKTDVTFTVAKSDLPKVKTVMEAIARKVGALGVRYDEDIVKVSIVGLGMRSHAGVAAKMFRLLAGEGINIQAISTSEIKVSCLVATKYTELAVRALHDGFGLGETPVP